MTPVYCITGVLQFFCVLLLLVLAGCATDDRQARTPLPPVNNDPLLSSAVPAPVPAAIGTPVPVGVSPPAPLAGGPASSPLPGLPASSSGASNAALVSAPSRPLDPTHDLRIGAPSAPAAGSWQGQPSAGAPFTPPPAPLFQPTSGQPLLVRGAAPVPWQRLATYEQAQAVLASRGVRGQHLDTLGDGQWTFSCSVPSSKNQYISRTYEARAATNLAAIQAVLDKMDSEPAQ